MPVSVSVVLAKELNWFAEAGVEVEVKEYSLGKVALEDLALGRLEIAAAAVTPLVNKALESNQFRIFATIGSSTGIVGLVARKDREILKIGDIEGKNAGVARGTSSEFLFETLRVMHRVPRSSVNIIDRDVDGLVAGIMEGSLDVISLWEPHITALSRAMPGKLTNFYAGDLYQFTWNLVATPETIEKRRLDLEKVIKTLFRASDYIQREPAAARDFLIRRLGDKGRDMARFIEQARYEPALSQDLLSMMEAEARWMMNRNDNRSPLPNFLRWIDTSILGAVRPESVTMIK